MHKGVMLLTKASDRDEAVSNVESFLENYKDNVWDWYVIGGRWSGTLNPKAGEFFKLAEAHFKKTYPDMGEFLSTKMVEEQSEVLQSIWSEELGGDGFNPYKRDNYSSDGCDDDVLPLTECISAVNKWTKDMDAEAEIFWGKMIESKSEKSGHDMSAYYAKRYAESKYDEFCFESNVYDIDEQTNNPKDAIENPNEYFVVMVDMHN